MTEVWPPFSPDAVVFDLDGLLVDSEPLWGLAEERVVLDLGHPWDPSIPALLLGQGPEGAAAMLAARLGGVHADEVSRRMLAAAVAEFESGVKAQPGAHDLVRSLGGRLPLALATNSRRVLAELALTSAGFDGCFQVVVCAEDVRAPKPAPDPYHTACARLGADPVRSVAFEDSPVGVASARAAGLWVVGCLRFLVRRLKALTPWSRAWSTYPSTVDELQRVTG
jgi:HAD superfamily hydrolase (TIGR01509 family)